MLEEDEESDLMSETVIDKFKGHVPHPSKITLGQLQRELKVLKEAQLQSQSGNSFDL
jgi:hypothetical protein